MKRKKLLKFHEPPSYTNEMRKLGSISSVEFQNDPDAPWLILFHGYGADAGDLAGLTDYFVTPKPLNYLYPNGLLEVPIGPGWTGRAWWTLDMEKLAARSSEPDYDMGAEIPDGLPAAREKALKMIEALGVPWDQIILGGFSQGGMLAADIAFHAPSQPRGLVLMSTSIINKKNWNAVADARKGLPFFQSHGDRDQVLTLKNAQRMESFLTQHGLKGRLNTFGGGHEIPPGIIQKLNAWFGTVV